MESMFEEIFTRNRCTDFRWIEPSGIRVAHWVRMKCHYGCGGYGACAACPPETPSVAECREFFREYSRAALFHFRLRLDGPDERHAACRAINRQLLSVERDVFLAGEERSFALFADNCSWCDECAGERRICRNKKDSRPTIEAMGVDVYSLARGAGYHIEVCVDDRQAMDRFGLLLIR
ncbi:MAG TPA: DUF2284 domain-containing protein [Spirochaetota bacterium]|nr:DUF2284 domain-containing protein [Spirochaetota bacterium]HNT13015.1 DUF2284 domain-containing protein [Spirochaetota bacterium]